MFYYHHYYYYYYFTPGEFFTSVLVDIFPLKLEWQKVSSSLWHYYYFTPGEFFTSVLADGFSLDFEWQQVSRTRRRIFGRSQQCCHLGSHYPSANFQVLEAFNNLLVIVPKAPITIDTIVTFMFHSFFNSLARSRYLSFFSHSFRFILWSAGTAKLTILQILFFLLIIIRSGLLAGVRWSVCMLKSHRNLCMLILLSFVCLLCLLEHFSF